METLRFLHNSVLEGFRGRWLRLLNWIYGIPQNLSWFWWDILCFPFHLIFSHVALSIKYCKCFCSDFILAISGSIVYHQSIFNSLITSFSRFASEPELLEPESFKFGSLTFSSKLLSDTCTSYTTWEGTERLFRSWDMLMRMTTTNWISQELGIIYIVGSHYSKNYWIIMLDPSMNKWIAPQATSGRLCRIFICFMHYIQIEM